LWFAKTTQKYFLTGGSMSKWFDVKMKNGEVIEIDDEQHKSLRRILAAKFSERPDFYFVDDERSIKIDYIATVLPWKDL
jgi:hypothetical protein